MKKFGVIGIVCLLVLLCGCKNPLEETKYLALSVLKYNDKTESLEHLPVKHKTEYIEYYEPVTKKKKSKSITLSYVELSLNDKFYTNYFLIPEQKKSVTIDEIYYDFNIIEIDNIDNENNLISFYCIKSGETKIQVHSPEYNTATSLLIVIKD